MRKAGPTLFDGVIVIFFEILFFFFFFRAEKSSSTLPLFRCVLQIRYFVEHVEFLVPCAILFSFFLNRNRYRYIPDTEQSRTDW